MKFADNYPTLARFGRLLWKRTRPWVRPMGFILVSLATLVALVVAAENYRTGKAWENYKSAARARGEKLTLAELAPPMVPDDQNFAMTPLLKPLFTDPAYGGELAGRLRLVNPDEISATPELGDWRTGQRTDLAELAEFLHQPDVLTGLQPYNLELAEISAAIVRPFSRFPIAYDRHPSASILLPHLQPIVAFGRLFCLRGVAELATGKNDAALADVLTVLRLAQATRDEPTFVSKMVVLVVVQQALQIIWEGLAARQWSEPQLAVLQREMEKLDLMPQLIGAERGERAFYIETIEWMEQLGFVERLEFFSRIGAVGREGQASLPLPVKALLALPFVANRALLAGMQFDDQYLVGAWDPVKRQIDLSCLNLGRDFVHEISGKSWFIHPESLYLARLLPAWEGMVAGFAEAQTSVAEAAVACALERSRLATGHYPKKLDELAPQFISQLPADLITGGPLLYLRDGADHFVLYSFGWSGTDNHDEVYKEKRGGDFNLMTENWVWQYPTP